MSNIINCKVVAVGDGAVGKTCLLMVYAKGEFPKEYVPTVFENYDTTVRHNNKLVKITLWDTAGQEEFDQLRYLSYPNANVFLVCFSLMSKTSLENVKDKWLKELDQYSKGTPIILVGTKLDMRDDENEVRKVRANKDEIVTTEQGQAMAKQIKAHGYMETSAKQGTFVQEIFQKCLEIRMGKQSSGGCFLL